MERVFLEALVFEEGGVEGRALFEEVAEGMVLLKITTVNKGQLPSAPVTFKNRITTGSAEVTSPIPNLAQINHYSLRVLCIN